MGKSANIEEVKRRLVIAGGRLAQEFGFNRVAGEVLVSLYLTPREASLTELEGELKLSKAAVSLAAAQLERLGLIYRVRHFGDRKRYYRSADEIGSALRKGLLTLARAKVTALATDLREAQEALASARPDPASAFLLSRVRRLQDLSRRADRLLAQPLLKLFSKLG